ncbi:zinc-binding dehydrogenase [Leptothoe sp. PORK10 BA2]|uniref:zinc-binding dehydrogenase n=1 Tax=Leptothoe sp. PORK10 BA2 TaxID=3110254 RepID=UPI002B1EEBFE|nr:zinc-binding dehydrogenase [Leptothoe sp. PORK10 BA2]MEA5464039.1 zinc-binding dehydrogenase [Leptothoe sp. PORK10 BA2]
MATKRYRKLVARQCSHDFPSAIDIVEEDIPQPETHQVLIRNRFAGVNAGFDTLLCRGEVPYVNLQPPFDLGVEAVGEVVAMGAGVTRFTVGDAVATTVRGGGYREYQVIDAALAIQIPEAIPEILTLMPTGISALVGLERVGEMGSGETILITAAAGGIGHIAVQLAKLAGNHVIGTCGSEAKGQLLEGLGCDRTINYHQESVHDVLAKEYPEGIDLVFDCVGKQMFDTGIDHLAVGGRFVIVGFISEYGQALEVVSRPRIYEKLFWKAASVRGFLLPHYAEAVPAACDRLLALFQQGAIKVAVDPTDFHGIEAIPTAVNYLLSGQNCGKVVVRF